VDNAHVWWPHATMTSKLPSVGVPATTAAAVSFPKQRMDAGVPLRIPHTKPSPTAMAANRRSLEMLRPRQRQQWSSPLLSTLQTRYSPEDSARSP
jgi:hypothetical protein